MESSALLIGDSGTDEIREGKYIDQFAEQHVNSLLVTPSGSGLGKLEEESLRETPVMLVDREPGDFALSSVTVDNVAGGRMALDHLLAGGQLREDGRRGGEAGVRGAGLNTV